MAHAGVRQVADNVFVLVDGSHRGQYKTMHAKMRKAIPRGCFIGFTGTPVRKKEKDTIIKFGGLIQPTYSIRDAVEDRAVVPLLYEGRDVEQRVDKEPLDRWFDIITANLSKEQKADLKKKFTTTDQMNKTEQKVREIALDISMHYRDNWQSTGYKAQLVTQDKATAMLYHQFLEEFGTVSSAVLISGPDDREGNEDVEIDEEDLPAIQKFWKKMMTKHGSEDQYNKNIINGFKAGGDPEIIIVVDKLLTGFDAPRNTVLYLTRTLKDHTLLQAIARVNRLSTPICLQCEDSCCHLLIWKGNGFTSLTNLHIPWIRARRNERNRCPHLTSREREGESQRFVRFSAFAGRNASVYN